MALRSIPRIEVGDYSRRFGFDFVSCLALCDDGHASVVEIFDQLYTVNLIP